MHLHLFGCPRIEVDRLDFADMGAHPTMYARAANAEENAPDER